MFDSDQTIALKGPTDKPRGPEGDSTPSVSTVSDEAASTGGEGPWLHCRFCGARVTPASSRIFPGGQHHHTFANPHGYVFHVRCFSIAPGVMPVGKPSAEFSWFSGYTWQVAICSQCLAHLGWAFQGSGSGFYALIGDRLRMGRE